MFDFIRDLRKPAEQTRQERLNAFLDGALKPADRLRLEDELAGDDALRAELESLRRVKMQLAQLPQVRAPRNFTLDPAVYGKPDSALAYRAYPALRTATVMAAIFLVALVTLQFGALRQPDAVAIMQQTEATSMAVAAEEAPAEAPLEPPVAESLRVLPGESDAAAADAYPPAVAPLSTITVEEALQEAAEPSLSEPLGELSLSPTPAGTPTVESESVRLTNEAADELGLAAADTARETAEKQTGLTAAQYVTLASALIVVLLFALTLVARSRI